MALAVAVALAAAVAFGWSTALMHQSASSAPRNLTRPDSLLWHLVHQPRWLLGEAASLTGLALHLWALSLGSIVVVQPLVATGLVFALAFRSLLDRKRPSTSTLTWAGICAIGVAVFSVATNSGESSNPVDGRRAAIMLAVGCSISFVAWLFSMKLHHGNRGRCWAYQRAFSSDCLQARSKPRPTISAAWRTCSATGRSTPHASWELRASRSTNACTTSHPCTHRFLRSTR